MSSESMPKLPRNVAWGVILSAGRLKFAVRMSLTCPKISSSLWVLMAAGLLLYDALYTILAVGLYGTAGTAGWEVARRLPLPVAFAALVGVIVFLVTLLALVALGTALCPRLVAGSYPMMRGRVFHGWLFRSMLRRILFFAPLKSLYLTSNVLRWLSLRALGAEVAFASSMSNDVDLIDPALLRVERGAMIGARALVAGHYIADGRLVLAPVVVGAGALVGGDVIVGPGARIGARATIQGRAAVGRGAVVGEGAVVGAMAYVGTDAEVAPGERVPSFAAHRRGESTDSARRRT